MDLLNGKIKTIYFKYLLAASGSVLISSIYGLVDMAMVGQYQGPDGAAALAVVAPVWNIIYSLGLLTGIGGAVLYSTEKGKGGQTEQNSYFTASVIFSCILGIICWLSIIFFDEPLLRFFGADETLLPLAQSYLYPIKFVVPTFLFSQMLAAFLRNDNAPGLATAAVLSGGIFNIFGDWFFVFFLDLGIIGAGIATAIGSLITIVVALSHFFTKKNTLKLVKPAALKNKIKKISICGSSAFLVDMAMGILTVLFNRQIMKYLGSDSLSVYGVIINISTIVQCCAYGAGQSAQPIISMNYGAGKKKRVFETLKYSLYAVAFFSVIWTAVVMLIPNNLIHIFMAPTEIVLSIAPGIMRCYALSFMLLPLNIYSTYYFQSIMQPKIAFIISILRGVFISGCFILLFPLLFGSSSIWLAMPITEFIIAILVVVFIAKSRLTIK